MDWVTEIFQKLDGKGGFFVALHGLVSVHLHAEGMTQQRVQRLKPPWSADESDISLSCRGLMRMMQKTLSCKTLSARAGTLMEVVSHLWLEDGRLLILAVGLCRIKVCSNLADRILQKTESRTNSASPDFLT